MFPYFFRVAIRDCIFETEGIFVFQNLLLLLNRLYYIKGNKGNILEIQPGMVHMDIYIWRVTMNDHGRLRGRMVCYSSTHLTKN